MNGGGVKTAGSDIAVMGNAEEATRRRKHGDKRRHNYIRCYGNVSGPQSGTTTIKGGSITGVAGIEIKSGRA